MKPTTSLPIDVIIPVYNGEKYIKEAVQSVINQTASPHQILIVDDGSTDTTAAIVATIPSHIPIHIIKKKNGGLSSARNAGIKHASSSYLAFLDADDRWEKTKLAKQWQVFERSTVPQLGIVYTDYYLIDAHGNRLNAGRFQLNPACRGDIYAALLDMNVVAGSGSAVLVKRACFDAAGLFDQTLTNCEDWDMWLRISLLYQYDYVAEELVAIRRHSSSMQTDVKNMMLGQIRVMNKHTQALLRYPPRFRSPGNASYIPLTLVLIKDIANRQFIKTVWSTMSPDLRRHFKRQLPFVLADLIVKTPPFLIKKFVKRVRR